MREQEQREGWLTKEEKMRRDLHILEKKKRVSTLYCIKNIVINLVKELEG